MKFRIAIGICLLFFICAISHYMISAKYELWETSTSPDNKYTLTVLRDTTYVGFPGSSSDAPGIVELSTISGGKVIFRRKIQMVLLADEISWHTNCVNINFIDGVNFDGSIF